MLTKEQRAHFNRVCESSPMNLLSYRYEICNKLCEWFKDVLPENEKFVFGEPCDGCGGYDIYAIANVHGIIMAEFIWFGDKKKDNPPHTLGTKGTESVHAMLTAAWRYWHGLGHTEKHPEYASSKIDFTIASK